SSAGEEWERERREIGVSRDTVVELVQAALQYLIALPDRPRHLGRPFPWVASFSDGRRLDDVSVLDNREDAVLHVDLRFLTTRDERAEALWLKKSAETALQDRLVWVCGDTDPVESMARELVRSRQMVRRYEARESGLPQNRKQLLLQEKARFEALDDRFREVVAHCFHSGFFAFRGRTIAPSEHGAAFAPALFAVGQRLLPDLFPHYVATTVVPSELMQLLEPELNGPSPKFLPDDLGILELDGGRYVPSCSGVVPRRVLEFVEAERGVGGTSLLAHFGRPPYGYTAPVVKACVAGLLRAGKIKLSPEGGAEITALRDAGVRDLFEKDRSFRRASLFPAGDDDIGFPARARICKLFAERLGATLDREDHAIADAVSRMFPATASRLRAVIVQMDKLQKRPETPVALVRLQSALEQCVAVSRQTKPTVLAVLKHLDVLRDGLQLLDLYQAEITDEAIAQVLKAHDVMRHRAAQLREAGASTAEVEAAATRIDAHLDTERPWREIGGLDADLDLIRAAWRDERTRIAVWRGELADAARARVKARPGYTTLSSDQSNHVLSALRLPDVDLDAIQPSLHLLRTTYEAPLRAAEEEANHRLDEILSKRDDRPVRPVDLKLRGRELTSDQQVEALLEEIAAVLREHVRSGARVRLL
ncbi:MAG: BREX system P-loop protein BrxC, partial [Myxococcales bacterium]|nr:BREX system P-loop protein BrxC [Myxococcales bacterium]